jgi:delta1-piperideine-2-carboxylate reductase
MEDSIRLSLKQVYDLAERIFLHHGASAKQASAMAETLAAGERDACASHGLYRVLGCTHSIKVGKIVPDAEPEIIDLAPSLVKVTGK